MLVRSRVSCKLVDVWLVERPLQLTMVLKLKQQMVVRSDSVEPRKYYFLTDIDDACNNKNMPASIVMSARPDMY